MSGGILSEKEIVSRHNEIFKAGFSNECVRQASYELRLSRFNLFVKSAWHDRYEPMTLSIEPGEIAVLSTEELITMPPDLAGRVTIKFTYACQGLITLFGSQVDPFYGRDFRTAVERKEAGNDLEYDGQRLYLLVMNAFRGQININLEDDNARRMFVFDIYKVYGTPASSGPSRPNMDKQIRRKIQI